MYLVIDFLKNNQLHISGFGFWSQSQFNSNKLFHRFQSLPIQLLDLFRHATAINLAGNSLDCLDAFALTKQKLLTELDLSGNRLTSLERRDLSAEERELRDHVVMSGEPLLKSLERLNLAGNRLNGLACMNLNQMSGLKYLNLSDNDFQLNPLAEDFYQMPWQSNKSVMGELLELDLSRNNKKPQGYGNEQLENSALILSQSGRSSSVLSNFSNFSSLYSETTRQRFVINEYE